MGVGRRRRLRHRMDVRPHPLGRHARRAVARRRPRPGRGGRGDPRVRLGTLVASPNFRHPVTLARDALALDDLSDGRFDLGVGPGSGGPDARALGQEPWSPAERMDRFGEFLAGAAPGRSTATRTDPHDDAHGALRRR